MTAIFVTASGTDIGKTFVACGLVRALRAGGCAARALKPVVSGFDPSIATTSDPGLLLAALGRDVTLDNIAAIAPWRYTAPLSPDMAARRENRVLDYAALLDFCRAGIANPGPTVIEGVGGVMAPLDERHTVLDWMSDLKLPVLVVVGSHLGAISHALTALDAVTRRGLIASVVVNASAGSTVDLDETADTIRRFAPDLDVTALPRHAAQDHPVFTRLAARLWPE
jgi:dethiobiotin synthetase